MYIVIEITSILTFNVFDINVCMKFHYPKELNIEF